jgi:hypothetical protein
VNQHIMDDPRIDDTAPDADTPSAAGSRVMSFSWAATVLFAVTAVPTMVPVRAFDGVSVVVALALFALSIPIWLYAFAVGVGRSRENVITISGLFFLRGAAPGVVRRLLLGSLFATLLITVITASSEPFGVLVPVLPLALAGLWGARYGTFPERPPPPPRRKGTSRPSRSGDDPN